MGQELLVALVLFCARDALVHKTIQYGPAYLTPLGASELSSRVRSLEGPRLFSATITTEPGALLWPARIPGSFYCVNVHAIGHTRQNRHSPKQFSEVRLKDTPPGVHLAHMG